jgi:signal transduction histidine kinase
VHPHERERVQAIIQRAYQDHQPFVFEHTLVRPDGSTRSVLSRGRIDAKDGKAMRMMGTAQDITEQKEAEEARLRLAQERAARALAEEAQRRASFLADASRLVNESLELDSALSNVARAATVEFADACAITLFDNGTDRHFVHARRDVETVQRTWEAICNEPRLRSIAESAHAEILAADDAALGSILIAPLAARHACLGMLAFVLHDSNRHFHPADVTLAEELGRRAGQSIDNARLYLAAQDGIRARDEFLSVASHELRTPLSTLLLQLGALRHLVHDRSGKLVDKVEGALSSTDRLSTLVDRLLDVSRIVAGRLELEIRDIDLSQLAQDVVQRVSDEAAKAGCTLQLSADSEVIGMWDRLRIEQMLTNLLSNGFKYGAGKPIAIVVVSEGGEATLSVRDHGMGIPTTALGRIFDRFERAVPPDHFGGLGLGLYITRQIAEAHGGSISVDSKPGAGAIFTVRLPQRTT